MKARRAGLVSVILVNFRGADDTIACVHALYELNWPADQLEIVVVENGSGDDSLDKLRSLRNVLVVESKENLGFAGGSNLGVAKSSGEYLAFINNDARPHPEWIDAGLSSLTASPEIGAVASKVLDWSGERVDFLDAAVTWYGMGYKPHAGETDRGEWDDEKDVLFGTGAAMLVRASIFEELGGFDEQYFMFYEDVDFGWRLNLLGYRFRFQPKSVVYHKHHASIDKFGNFRETYLLERNALYTLYKNLEESSLAQVLPSALLLAVRRAVARGRLDSSSLELSVTGGDAEPESTISKQTLAGIYALDQFVEALPQMADARANVQATRRVPDRQLRHLFGNTDEPAYPIDSYLEGYEKIVDHLGQLNIEERLRVLVITGDPIGSQMAGPAIRAWSIATTLAKENQVRVLSMTSIVALDDRIETGVISPHRPMSIKQHEEWADVIIVQGHALALFPLLEGTAKILVVDVYDPLHLEQLEQGKSLDVSHWHKQVEEATETLNHQLALGDFFLCASPRQRHFWLGQLAAVGRLNPSTYLRDKDLETLISVVPFGIPDADPLHTRPVLRGIVPGIGAGDKIILWAGGIYDWFDPLTLIRAVAELATTHPNIRLFFMGVQHPNPSVPEMAAVKQARSLADRLGLTGKHVFFNDSWVPYEARQNYLLEADLGVSTHFQHVETTYSFRTRILDYLWAGLPIVTTRGDSFGDLVSDERLGAAVPEQDVGALVQALEEYLFDVDAVAAARQRVGLVRERFRWSNVLAPLVEFCRAPTAAADKQRLRRSHMKSRRTPTLPLSSARQKTRRTGLRRDLERVLYYMKNGGPAAVVERFRARQQRRKAAGS